MNWFDTPLVCSRHSHTPLRPEIPEHLIHQTLHSRLPEGLQFEGQLQNKKEAIKAGYNKVCIEDDLFPVDLRI